MRYGDIHVTLGANTFGPLVVEVWTPRDNDDAAFRFGNRQGRKEGRMKKEYDFSKGKRGVDD